MSENEDDRMDRAERIRQLREGGGRGRDTAAETPVEKTGDEEEVVDEGNATAEEKNGDEEEATDEVVTSREGDAVEGTESEEGGEEADENESEESASEDTPEAENFPDEIDPADIVPETADIETEKIDTTTPAENSTISAPLPDSEQLEEALETGVPDGESEEVTPKEVAQTGKSSADGLEDEREPEEETRVLEFKLGDEYYCLDIEYIEEIVKEETITRVPNTPAFVEGVVDLRGQITTILNPKITIGKDDVTPGGLIIVFDADSFEDQGHVGWVVDDVRQVSPITDTEVNDPPIEEDYINGVIDREDDEEFVIWTTPDMAMEEAE